VIQVLKDQTLQLLPLLEVVQVEQIMDLKVDQVVEQAVLVPPE
jgi:hypothetical protein